MEKQYHLHTSIKKLARHIHDVVFSQWLRLRELRKVQGWTIEEAAEYAGVDPSTYSRWELGRQRPHPSNLLALLRALNLDGKIQEDLLEILVLLEHLDAEKRARVLHYLLNREQEDKKQFERAMRRGGSRFDLKRLDGSLSG